MIRQLKRKQNALISFMMGFGFASLMYSQFLIKSASTNFDSGTDASKLGIFGPDGLQSQVRRRQQDIADMVDATKSANPPITEQQLKDELEYTRSKAKKYLDKTEDAKDEIQNESLPISSSSSGMCSAFLSSSSPSSIWSKHLKEIFHASRHNLDKENEYIWHDFTAILLNYMSPRRLQSSIKTLPSRYWDQVGKTLKLGLDRYQFLQSNAKGAEPRKINILVMGGSVTMGVFCKNNPVKETSRFLRRGCAWPTRLGQFLNNLFGDIVNVDMITLGGTNTESATQMWDYTLFPTDMPHPDILIHAYSTNDMHVLSENEAIKRGITLEDMIMTVNQDFVRTILRPPSSCKDRPTPLLLYFDDYIGNEQRAILKTNSFGRATQTLANYYGFGLISYADAVRDLVYSDTSEDWFSPSNWPERQVHPGMGMHISSMWFVAYNLLNIVSAYCSDDFSRASTTPGHRDYKAVGGLPTLRRANQLKGEPKPVPLSLPPKLNTNTTLDNISSKWHGNAQLIFFDLSTCEKSNNRIERCTFSWVGGLERFFEKPEHLEKRMKPILVSNEGWRASADNGKLGYEATKTGATFEMKVEAKELEVQTLNFMVMTSYGEKWDGSKVRVGVYIDRSGKQKANNPIKTMDIVGFHDRHTSETYNYKLNLENETVASKDVLRVRISLIGGSAFKFTGMALCDH
jgi:hypothetical protein